jgi:GTP-binding protein Era
VSKAGFVGVAGRPNVGKSTLVNAIVGAHVAIVSERPQTTRRAIRGVATDADAGWQLVLTDLPGVQRPRDALTERMQRRVEREIGESDAVLFVVNGEQGVGPGDRFIAKALLQANADTPVVCAVNKVDRLNNAETAAVLAATAELHAVDEIFPVSARKGVGLEALIAKLVELTPE